MKKHFSFFSAAVFTAVISTFSCSSGGGNDTPHGGSSVSSGTDDPALYCVVEALSYCVTGLSGKQCRDDGYRGNGGYSDTKCPSGYDIITKVGSSSSFGGQGGISSSGGSSQNYDYCVMETEIANICYKYYPADCVAYTGGRLSNSCPYETCIEYTDSGTNAKQCEGSGGNSSSSSSSIGNVISSSSSIGVSSSSIINSSSSVGVNVSSSVKSCTAADNTATHYCSDGTMKEYGILTDSRDNKTYKTITIGTKVWMAENLNYNENIDSQCYNHNDANCRTYGRLYSWKRAMNTASSSIKNPSGVKGLCPDGSHLPSKSEWFELLNVTGFNGAMLKATSVWLGRNGTDDYGFSALPGGYFLNTPGNGSFDLGSGGYWWSATEESDTGAAAVFMNRDNYITDFDLQQVGLKSYPKSSYLLSVRCVKD
jgi:uncharacterized protein (TIGR02145 family)